MKFKLSAGAELDLLNKDELAAELGKFAAAWKEELARGVKFVDFSQPTTTDGTGAWSVSIEVPNGFLWSVTRVAVSGAGYDPTADTYAVFSGENTPSKLVADGIVRDKTWPIPILTLHGGTTLIVAGTNATATSTLSVSGAAVEVPAQYARLLLG